MSGRGWWESRWAVGAFALLMAVPLLWPALPPLTDLPEHMGRWHISMSLGSADPLARYYGYSWRPLGNLGMDLLVPALALGIGLEPAAKLAVILIPVLTAIGLLWTAREAHGRIPPFAILALPLAYAWPFQFGFVNFALAQALAFCAFALWLRLGRLEQWRLRAALFVPIACILWIAHDFGWGLFGLMAFGAEAARLRESGRRWVESLAGAAVQCLPLALPILFMAASAGQSARGLSTGDWFNFTLKLLWLLSVFRDRWEGFDLISIIPLLLALYLAVRSGKLGFAPLVAWPALLCGVAFLLLPRLLLGGAYVDTRMAPAMLMLALVAIRAPEGSPRLDTALALLATAFLLVRTGGTTVSFALRAGEQQRELAAIAHVPKGAAVLSLVSRPCPGSWSDLRRDHLPALAIVRRDAFTNGQWAIDGQQLVRIRYAIAGRYAADPSQLVYPPDCPHPGSHFEQAIAGFPRAAFDYVWTIGFPPGRARAADLHLIWNNGGSALYRVVRTREAAHAATPARSS